jgi:hypothetical protein
MTKTLSQLLGAQEPAFHLGIRQLERASGRPTEDIRLTNDVNQNRRACLRQLDLDPDDTTGEELYAALMQRVKEDSAIFESLLGLSSETGEAAIENIMPYVARLVAGLAAPKRVLGLKATTVKRLLRAHPPKKALKQLGYRSIESILKQEPAALLLAAASIAETAQWHKALRAAYKKLQPGDFELRDVQVLAPDSERWHQLAHGYVTDRRQAIMSFRELGAIVLLPFGALTEGAEAVQGAPLTATLLTLQAMNDVRAASTYVKLHMVQPDFGQTVAELSRAEPLTTANVAGANLPWKLVHQYFARHPEAFSPDLFEPHVQPDDLQWHTAEDSLAELHPRFAFWQTAACAGLQDRGETVSLNLIDSVLSFCNKLPYEQRIVHYVRDRLWHELMVRYIHSPDIEHAVRQQLDSQLTGELTT